MMTLPWGLQGYLLYTFSQRLSQVCGSVFVKTYDYIEPLQKRYLAVLDPLPNDNHNIPIR